jgi:hypothetical protein
MAHTLALRVPTFGFIVATRAALAFGAGLLVSERLPPARRRAVGLGLVAGGVLSTIPAIRWIRRAMRRDRDARDLNAGSSFGRDERLIGMTRFPRRGDDELAG